MVWGQWYFCAGNAEMIGDKGLEVSGQVLSDSGICRNRVDPDSFVTMIINTTGLSEEMREERQLILG